MHMKFVLLILVIFLMASCNESMGIKAGILQKVSHKETLANYYVAEFAYEGGKIVKNGESSAFQNTQEFEIEKGTYDSLSLLLFKKIVFTYKSRYFTILVPNKMLISYRVYH